MVEKSLIVTLIVGLLLPLTAVADECTDGDCINGRGTMTYATGHKYTGEFKDGIRHGAGILHMPGGRKIVGVWENNEITSGTYTEPDGTVYEGQWLFRERNGQGTLTFPDGRKYVGDFKSPKNDRSVLRLKFSCGHKNRSTSERLHSSSRRPWTAPPAAVAG